MIEYNAKSARAWSMLGPSGILGTATCELAEQNPNFAVMTADLCSFSGLNRFKKEYPDRLFNVGIAEQNMVGVAAGMAKEGVTVFAVTYATFASTRALDQVKVNMGYMNLPIKLVGMTAGYTAGILGATHMGLEDIAIMRSIPNMIILSPADGMETMKCLLAANDLEEPVYIRMTGASKLPIIYHEDYKFTVGESILLKEGSDISLMTTGTVTDQVMKAAELLEEEGLSCEVLDFHTIKPIDRETIQKACSKKLIVTIEEHSTMGGFGSAVSEVLASILQKPPQLILGVDDQYPHAASYDTLIERSGLTSSQIKDKIQCYMEEMLI